MFAKYSLVILFFSYILGNSVSFAKINILAIGDSLTKGYYAQGESYAPYTDTMNEIFDSSPMQIDIVNRGVDSLPIEIIHCNLEYAYEQDDYDLTIFLGGTNDLGYGFQEEEIINNLGVSYANILNSGSFLVGMTIPDLETINPQVDPKRASVNQWIRDYFKRADPKQALLFDLQDLVKNDWDKELFWDHDNVHFSPAGYAKIGEELVETFKASSILDSIEFKKTQIPIRSRILNFLCRFKN